MILYAFFSNLNNRDRTRAPKGDAMTTTAIPMWVQEMQRDNINDEIESIHLRLLEDKKYCAYLHAVYDAQAIEGSLAADNVMAAMMIRDAARTTGNAKLADEKLGIIVNALNVVLRHHGDSRKQRCNMIGGQIMPEYRSEEREP